MVTSILIRLLNRLLMFNLYISNLPLTRLIKFLFADDLAITDWHPSKIVLSFNNISLIKTKIGL